jgi:hypothetical protein
MKEVAKSISVPETTYREWEYGRNIKGIEPYIRLSKIFEVSIHELLTGMRSDKSLVIQEINSIQKNLDRLKGQVESLF